MGNSSYRFYIRVTVTALCAAALVSTSGCTTTRIVDHRDPLVMADELRAGDSVTLTLTDGRLLELRLLEETAQDIVGRDRTGAVRTIPRHDVARLDVREISALKTALLVGGIGVVVGAAQYAAAVTCLTGGLC